MPKRGLEPPRPHGRRAVVLVIIVVGLAAIIGALLVALFNPDLLAALLDKAFTTTMDLLGILRRAVPR
jgi:hypothetical protein